MRAPKAERRDAWVALYLLDFFAQFVEMAELKTCKMETRMKTDKPGERRSISSQLDEFLGRPTLLAGEDRKGYRQFLKMVSELLKPEDLFDELEVQEIANNIWAARRYQKLGTELVDAEHANAVRKLADSKKGYVSQAAAEHVNESTEIAGPGIGMHVLLNKLGISKELVLANSVLLAADNFAVLDRLMSNQIATRKTALKDYERRKRSVAKEKRLAAKAKRQVLANDNEPEQVKVRTRKRAVSASLSDWGDD